MPKQWNMPKQRSKDEAPTKTSVKKERILR